MRPFPLKRVINLSLKILERLRLIVPVSFTAGRVATELLGTFRSRDFNPKGNP